MEQEPQRLSLTPDAALEYLRSEAAALMKLEPAGENPKSSKK